MRSSNGAGSSRLTHRLEGRLLGQPVELSSGVGQRGLESLGDRREILACAGPEHDRGHRVADGDRRGQGQDAVDDVLLASAAEGHRATHVRDVIAPVVQHAQQQTEPLESIIASPESGADLEHGARVRRGDRPPVLDAHRLAPDPPLEAFRRPESLHQLGHETHAVRVGGNELRRRKPDVASGHEPGQEAVAAMERQLAAPVARPIEDVVDDQRHVVEELDGGRAARRTRPLKGRSVIA